MFQEKQILRMGCFFSLEWGVLVEISFIFLIKIGGNLFPCAGVINIFSRKVLFKSVFNI